MSERWIEETFPTTSHLSVAMTTSQDDVTQTTGGSAMTPSSSDTTEVVFRCAVVIIGIIGTAANGLVLYAMVASKQHKKQLLIFNQNIFDLFCCLILTVTYILKLCNIYLTWAFGYWLCMLLISENLLWLTVNGSVMNLLSITIERYIKVVHPALGKKYLRNWVIYAAIAFIWISAIIFNMAVVFSTSKVIDGVCYGYTFWASRMTATIYGVWHFISFYVIVLIGFVFCYGRILIVIRRQAKVMAAHSRSSTTQTSSNKAQSNVIKTMILVCTFYVITGTPDRIYYLLVNVLSLPHSGSVHYAKTFIAFFYICTNPFIYATKFDPVRRELARLIICKSSVEPAENATTTNARSARSTQDVRQQT